MVSTFTTHYFISMRYTSGSIGKVVVLRFEENDPIYQGIEEVAEQEQIQSGMVWIIGGVKNCGIVVGPRNTAEMPPDPLIVRARDAHEIVGIGTLFRDSQNSAKLHLHAALGKGTQPVVGCPRVSLNCWLVTEVVIMELRGIDAFRYKDRESGFELLEILSPQHDSSVRNSQPKSHSESE